MVKLCAVWNNGVALKAFVRSALSPENMKLLRRTSRVTSLLIPSTVPGFDSPNVALLSWKVS